jgi:predicted DNA-binding protein YlxM (UPF0122 family)
MAKKKQAQQQQQEPGIIKPDFSALIEQMQQEQARAGKKQRPKPETKREQEPEVITVTPADIEPPRKHEGSEQERERQERLERARELVQEEKQEREKERDSGSEGEVLEPIDYPRGGPQTTPDVERQIEILQQAIEQGESIPVIAKRYGVSRRAIQHYIAQAKEEIELNSQLLDIKLVESLDTKIREIVLAVDKSKLATATVRDLAIAAGIFLDKRKELLGPRSGTGNLRLRATFRGEGAIEVTTGEQ